MAFEIIASINTAGSIKEISEKLKNEVASGVNAKLPLKIVATIDTQKTISEINNSLNSLNGIAIKNIGFDNTAIKNVQGQVKNITNDVVKELQTMTNTMSKASSKAKEISNSFATLREKDIASIKPIVDINGLISVDKTIASLKDRFSEFNNIVGKGNYGDNGQLNGIQISMKNTDNEARTLRFSLKELDDEIKMFVFNSGSYTDKGVEKQFEKADAKAKILSNTLEKLKFKYTDVNNVKPIKNEQNLETLSNKYKEVETAIHKVGSANSSNMSQLETTAKTLISEYERLAVSLQNAEYMATSLRTKDIGTIQNVAKQDLNAFENQIKNSKVPIKEMNDDLAKLKNTLSQTLNKEQLTNYFNSFDIAKAKFKALEQQYKTNEQSQKNYISSLEKQSKIISDLQIKQIKLKEGSQERLNVEKQLAEEQRKYNGLLSQTYTTNAGYQTYYMYDEAILKVVRDLEKLRQAKLNEANTQLRDDALKQYVSSMDNSIKKLSSLSNLRIFDNNSSNPSVIALRTTVGSLTERFEKLKSTMGSIKTPEQFKTFENELSKLNTQFGNTILNAKSLQKQFQNDNSSTVLSSKIQTLKGQIERFMIANPKAMRNGYKNQFDELLNSLKGISNSNAFNEAKKKFQSLTSDIDKLGLRGASVFDTLKQKVSKFASWIGITMVTASVAREIRGMYSTIIELDTALVDLNKTFTGTSADLEDFYYSANKTAKQLGTTTKEVIDSASSWSRLGYSSKEASLAMAEFSSIFKSISPGMTIDDATDGLVSMMKAFGVEVDNVQTQIMDKVNIIGNTLAVSNSDIIESMKRSSSALALGNNSIQEAIALTSASTEITRNAEKSGNAWRVASMRIRGYDEETEELSEDLKNITGEIADLTKVAGNNFKGVSIFTDDTKETYRSTYQIMNDIANIWNEMSDKNQAELLEKLGGKMNSQVIGSALINWENARKAMRTMEESYGSSQKEMEKYYDSLEYKINNFKETITEIAQSTITRDFLKGIVDDSTKMLETFANFGSVLRPLYDMIGSGVSIIADVTNAFGGLDKVLAGFALSKGINALSRGVFGADRAKKVALI